MARTPAVLRSREWLPASAPRAQLLAAGIESRLAEELAGQGIAVVALQDAKDASLRNLAWLGIDLRKRQPRLPLFTWAPAKLGQEFAAKYPPLTDGVFDSGQPSGLEKLRKAAGIEP